MRRKRDITEVVRIGSLGLNLILPKVKAHLMSLPEDDKYKRFYTPVTEAFIDRYLSGITLDARGDAVFVVYDDGGEDVVGMCHVAVTGSGVTRSAELALSVSDDYRHRHIGIDMLERAILHCNTLGITKVFMYCLKSNTAMQHMAKKLNMKVVTDYDESVGTLELAEGKVPAAIAEALTVDTVAMFDLGYRQMVNTASHMFAAALTPFTYKSQE
jgi:RimJ/RimL family protein N-acetyltransferase